MTKITNFLNDNLLFILIGFAIILIGVLIWILNARNKRYKKYMEKIEKLDREKVKVINLPIEHEIAKLNYFIKNKELLIKIAGWEDRWLELKRERVAKVTDSILAVEDTVMRKRFKGVDKGIADSLEMIDVMRSDAEELRVEIEELLHTEEEIRNKVTAVKKHFRDVKREYIEREVVLIYMKQELDERVSKIEKLIHDLEEKVYVNEYEKSELMVNDLNDEISVLELLVDKLPELIILLKKTMPSKTIVLEEQFQKYKESGVHLEHLNFENKIKEVNEMTVSIMEDMKRLDFTKTEYQINGLADYLTKQEELLVNEVKSYESYSVHIYELAENINGIDNTLNNLKHEIEKVKVLYELHDFDENEYFKYEEDVALLKEEYEILTQLPKASHLFSTLDDSVIGALSRAEYIREEIQTGTSRVLNLRADEQRAREQIVEIRYLVNESKRLIKKSKLPVIPEEFRVYLADAKDGIKYIMMELNKTPIDVEKLNKRVDTSLDLAYKLFDRTKVIVKEALLCEVAVVYGNRYRSSSAVVETGIRKSEELFYKGSYHDALNTVINVLEKTEQGIYAQLKQYFERGN